MPDESSNEATGASQETEGLDRKRGSSRNESNRYSSTPSGIMAALASSTAVFPATGAFRALYLGIATAFGIQWFIEKARFPKVLWRNTLFKAILNVVSFGAFSGTAAALASSVPSRGLRDALILEAVGGALSTRTSATLAVRTMIAKRRQQDTIATHFGKNGTAQGTPSTQDKNKSPRQGKGL